MKYLFHCCAVESPQWKNNLVPPNKKIFPYIYHVVAVYEKNEVYHLFHRNMNTLVFLSTSFFITIDYSVYYFKL